jgi:hypothetical protein
VALTSADGLAAVSVDLGRLACLGTSRRVSFTNPLTNACPDLRVLILSLGGASDSSSVVCFRWSGWQAVVNPNPRLP